MVKIPAFLNRLNLQQKQHDNKSSPIVTERKTSRITSPDEVISDFESDDSLSQISTSKPTISEGGAISDLVVAFFAIMMSLFLFIAVGTLITGLGDVEAGTNTIFRHNEHAPKGGPSKGKSNSNVYAAVNTAYTGRTVQREFNSANTNQHLLKLLFENYIKEAMPDRPVIVHFDVLLLKLKTSVEKEGIFESVLGLFIEWEDKRMSWPPEEFANLTSLTFDADQVWLPDIAMTNAADHLYSISKDTRFVVRVTFDGRFKFVPTGTARTWCDLRLITFPFDYQVCTLEFESWSMNSSAMTFDWQSRLLIDDKFSSTQWSLCKYRTLTYDHTYEFTNETFTRVEFELVVKRKTMFYVLNLIFPCATLSVIQLLVFLISSTDTTVDRIGFATTNLLTLVVFQTIVTAEMPKTSDAVTALSKYIIALIAISTLGIFESVMVERMLSTGLKPPNPYIMRLFQFIPVLWREKPDPLKNELKDVTRELIKSVDNISRIGISVNGRRNSILNMGMGQRTSSVYLSAESVSQEEKAQSLSDLQDEVINFSPPPVLSPTFTPRSAHFGRTAHSGGRLYQKNISGGNIAITSGSSNLTARPRLPSDNMIKAKCRYQKTERKRITSSGNVLQALEPDPKPPRTICSSGIRKEASTVDQARNALMWTEVAYRIDFLTFVTCAFLAVFIPIALFLPLALKMENCADSAIEILDKID